MDKQTLNHGRNKLEVGISALQGIDGETIFKVCRNCSTVVFKKRLFLDGFVFICNCGNHIYCNKFGSNERQLK
ncbi:MAG: hypothetical protein NTV58_13950 [Deltaproteobacteria bacterium]|nr:hypothetical protein [Deltaproteobacteria bacterium]